jgi:hypothetical protein
MKDDAYLIELENQKYDLTNLDTIQNSELIHAAMDAPFQY